MSFAGWIRWRGPRKGHFFNSRSRRQKAYLRPELFTMTRGKIFLSILFITAILVSCTSGPVESKFVKAARELFFDVDFSKNFDDAVTYYKANPNVVDGKLFEENTTAGTTKFDHRFVFQKHPVVTETFKGGGILVMRMDTSATSHFKESFYFVNAESAEKSFQLIDQKLRPHASKVVSSDSAGYKRTEYAAPKDDAIAGVDAELVPDSVFKGNWLHINIRRQ